MEGCASGNCDSVEAIATLNVVTPYFYTITGVYSEGDPNASPPEYNYDEYDLFCLKTRLAPHVKRIGLREASVDSWEFSFQQILHENVMRITVTISDGGEFVPITSNFHNELQSIVDDITSTNRDYCLLIHSQFNIVYKDLIIDRVWLNSVLKYLPIPSTVVYDQVRDTTYGYDSFYSSFVPSPSPPPSPPSNVDGVYVKLERKFTYTDAYYRLYMNTLNIIYDFYKRGTIALYTTDKEFIELWNLDEYTIDNNEVKLYYPLWINNWIAPDPTKFLLDRRCGIPYITFKIGRDLAVKHGVAVKLQKYKFRFIFTTDEVLVWVRNIIRADLAHSCIVSGTTYLYRKIQNPRVIIDVDTKLPPFSLSPSFLPPSFLPPSSLSPSSLPLPVVPMSVMYRDIKDGNVRSVVISS